MSPVPRADPNPYTDSQIYSVAGPDYNPYSTALPLPEDAVRNGAPPGGDEMPEYAQVNKVKKRSSGAPVMPVYAQVDKGRGRGDGAVRGREGSDTESVVICEDNELYTPSGGHVGFDGTYAEIPGDRNYAPPAAVAEDGDAEGYYNLPEPRRG